MFEGRELGLSRTVVQEPVVCVVEVADEGDADGTPIRVGHGAGDDTSSRVAAHDLERASFVEGALAVDEEVIADGGEAPAALLELDAAG